MIDALMKFVPLLLFGALMIAAMAWLTRRQSAKYQDYLRNHTAQSEKIAANQARLLEIEESRMNLLREQNAVLTRIAAAIEERSRE